MKHLDEVGLGTGEGIGRGCDEEFHDGFSWVSFDTMRYGCSSSLLVLMDLDCRGLSSGYSGLISFSLFFGSHVWVQNGGDGAAWIHIIDALRRCEDGEILFVFSLPSPFGSIPSLVQQFNLFVSFPCLFFILTTVFAQS